MLWNCQTKFSSLKTFNCMYIISWIYILLTEMYVNGTHNININRIDIVAYTRNALLWRLYIYVGVFIICAKLRRFFLFLKIFLMNVKGMFLILLVVKRWIYRK